MSKCPKPNSFSYRKYVSDVHETIQYLVEYENYESITDNNPRQERFNGNEKKNGKSTYSYSFFRLES